MLKNFQKIWSTFWMRRSGYGNGLKAKFTRKLACLGIPPYYGRIYLARITKFGYISPNANISHSNFTYGSKVYIDDNVLIYEDKDHVNNTGDGGQITLGEGVHLHRDTIIQTGAGGKLTIGNRTHIQPRCQINAYLSEIVIGNHVEIAPNCAFYPYNHGIEPGENIANQPITSKGGIHIEDDVWIGFGVIILDGVTIGKGAVIGAGSVVTSNIPPNAIAAGVPAKTIKIRE